MLIHLLAGETRSDGCSTSTRVESGTLKLGSEEGDVVDDCRILDEGERESVGTCGRIIRIDNSV